MTNKFIQDYSLFKTTFTKYILFLDKTLEEALEAEERFLKDGSEAESTPRAVFNNRKYLLTNGNRN